MPYRSRYRHSHHPSRAEQHILEAQSLHQKYGGAFDQVKGQFLSLDGPRMHSLLDAYGEQFGQSARAYAHSSLAKWRSGQVTMAGQTMTRLFDLLPRFMENEEKLALIRTLRAQPLRRLHRQQIRLKINDCRSLVHVAHQVMGMVWKIGTNWSLFDYRFALRSNDGGCQRINYGQKRLLGRGYSPQRCGPRRCHRHGTLERLDSTAAGWHSLTSSDQAIR